MLILLRHWREQRGYSVRELAKRAGMGCVTVSRIENGHMSPTVEMLTKALAVHVTDLFTLRRRRIKRR